MKRVRGLEKDDIRICVSEMIEIEEAQNRARVNTELSPADCTHERWDSLDCDDCRDAEVECSGRICLDCSDVWDAEEE